MSDLELTIIAVGLAMDAFALAICIGLSMLKMNWFNAFKVATYFGFFQGLMPAVGYFLGIRFAHQIQQIDHWIAFILLFYIGLNMIKESFQKEECPIHFHFMALVPLSVACSIDALAVGITLSFFMEKIYFAVLYIGIITFVISLLGVYIGQRFGDRLKAKADITGGLILIFMGFKILIEHLFFQ